jgi:hypothetical protein
MSSKKSLKECSFKDIEEAISEVTGTEVNASINNFKVAKDDIPALSEKDSFELQLSLKVGRNYESPW